MKKMYEKPFAVSCTVMMLGLALFSSCKRDNDFTVDTSNPMVVSYNPTSAAEGVAVTSNLVLTFDKIIKKGAGMITIASKADTQRINITSGAITIGENKKELIINPANDLKADENYSITIDRGIVTDLLGNQYMGFPDGKSWKFKTVGSSGLPLVSLSPLPESTDGSTIKLDLVFADDVKKGTGNFSVYEAGGTKVADYAVTGQSVTVNGKHVTIKFSAPLKYATAYYVLADAGAVVNNDGKAFEGFLTPASWAFTTTAGSGTALAVYLPLDNDLTDASGNKLDAMPGETATTNVTFVTDPERGRVASFAAGAYASLPKNDLLRPGITKDFSFSLWVKLKGIGSDPTLFGNSDWDSGSNPGFVFATDGGDTYTGPGSSGRGWLIKMTGDAGGVSNRMDWRANETSPQSPAVADNKWHMVTVVLDQTAKRLHVYIDATEYINIAKATSYNLNTLKGPLWDSAHDYPFNIWEDGTGHYNSGDDERKALAGLVDDVRIYNKALSAKEVAGLFVTH
ncbi:Ig-like domain-containing protein [Mucilaginibacter oryzae]|uniref:Ig-like domain-containing protein n=1 Tax=Mucilaginibacter oryzae TaxID=468058 RepID=A0A316HH54_9SPHI|nr:Ig-like domain-containing protein [Mucilaginibacter oryzae]PWK72545.1 Ig-like domain-containing protein [Mucilaginibacter oryzae]